MKAVLASLAVPALLLWAGVCTCAQEPADDRPNVLFILTDDHRPDAMGCYGNASIRTPHLDRIAREGARMDAFYVAAPLCCPSRAAFLSGLFPHQNGVLNNANQPDLKPDAVTVAEALASGGYVTGFIGKAHMGGDPRAWGFDETPVWLPTGGSIHRNPMLTVDGERRVVPGHITQIFADAAIRWLDGHRDDRWFLWLATTAPHTPYLRDPRHAYSRDEIQPPPLWPEGQPLGDADWEGYYSTISMLDEQIGRVLAKLEELGLLDDTLVFVIGDNGFMHGSHGEKAKSVWYEESARVPAIARWPGHIEPGTVVDAPLVSVDLFPTLCAAAGTRPPEGLAGFDMLPALSGGTPLRQAAYAEVQRGRGRSASLWQLVRAGSFKYVRLQDGGEILYDLATDPDEQVDRAADPEYADALKELRRLHRRWLKETPSDR